MKIRIKTSTIVPVIALYVYVLLYLNTLIQLQYESTTYGHNRYGPRIDVLDWFFHHELVQEAINHINFITSI